MNIEAPAAHENARIIIGASQLNAPNGRIDIKAYSDVLLESGENDAYTFLKTKSKSGGIIRKSKFTRNTNHLIMPAPTELNAGAGISIQSGGDIDAYSTRFNAPKGSVTLTAAEALNLLAIEGKHLHKRETTKSSRLIGIKIKNKDYKREELTETKLPVKVIAKGVNTRSGWDTVLEGTEFETGLAGANIQAGVGPKARADAQIILKGIVTRVNTEETSKSNSTVWQSMAGSGSVTDTLSLPKFEGPTPPKFSAPGGYIADIPKGKLKTEIEKLAKQPEYAYLKQLQMAKDVNWNQVQLEYQKWDYKHEGLTGAGAAIIALALAAVTGGAGAGIASALSGTAVTGISATMANAAFLSLATQASVSLVNNKGNLGKTFKDLGRSSTVKKLATAVITAGVADKIGASSALQWSDSATLNNLTVNLANAGSSAVISTTINGGSLGDSLESAIIAALVQTAHGAAASKIKGLNQHYVAHKIAHAVAGCAAAAANKDKCQDGAIGAVVGEIVGEHLTKNTDFSSMTLEQVEQETKKITAYAKLVAGTTAGIAGGNVNVAAQSAQTAVENNAIKAVVTGAKIVYKAAKKGLRNGKITTKDLKQTLKDEGYDLADNLITLSDGTLDWNDARAIIDIVVGTELNKANRGEAAKKVNDYLAKNKPYIPNVGGVPNMSTYMKHNPFGKQLSQISEKTKFQYQGQSVYTVQKSQGLLKTGDRFYLDGQHKNHLEIFDKNGNFRFVLDMNGSVNQTKTKAAIGRKLNLK
ncbi:S-layer family protein [Uruburuella testudinis]|uniref:S-layer family protein n=1 Tax=Uruburuella testudinis TaxID=1282863 RepID=A0ABY4DVY9_9NEIS|nr:S-layer family protein [Uruburuella testudinis]UOO83192.1 S-layer family protein [Uruburuella testudinis]